MRNKYQDGFMKSLVIIIFAIGVCVVFLSIFFQNFFVNNGGKSLINLNGSNNNSSLSSSRSYGNNLLSFLDSSNNTSSYSRNTGGDYPSGSPYAKQIRLSSGNARSAIQTYDEYITITNSGNAVNITGWTLTNSKGTRPIENIQVSYAYPSTESVTIGNGTEFLSPDGVFETGPIVLKRGDKAILHTGKPFNQFPFQISTSFRVNTCMGYLRDYPFNPKIPNYCPNIANDSMIGTVTDECYDYIRRMKSCSLPAIEDKKRFEETLTGQCKAFINQRVGYSNCVSLTRNSPNFSTNEWRIFLGRDREMWASSRETITLYDENGLIVDQFKY